jgi:hypothetical protein
LSFTGVENLTGGGQVDLFTVNIAGSLSGLLAGGAGEDELTGPARASAWLVNGANSGDLVDAATNQQTVQFAGIENLTGANTTDDDFVFTPGGNLSGVVDGGADGADSLVIQGAVNVTVVVPEADGDGVVTVDGRTVSYDGLDALIDQPISADDVRGTFLNDDFVLEADLADPGT